MRWNAVISVIVGLASSVGYTQSPPQQPDKPTPKARTAIIAIQVPPARVMQVPRPVSPPIPLLFIGGPMSSLEDGTAAVVGEPYSGIETRALLKDNKIALRIVTRLFRDTQGRTRVERTAATNSDSEPSPITISVTINDPVSGKEYTLEPQKKTAEVSPLPDYLAAVMQPPVTPPSPTGVPPGGMPGIQESKPISLGQKFINGIAVVGTRVEDTAIYPDREPETIVIDQWFSPELGVVILTTHQGGSIDSSERLEHIVRGEPDPALFTIPSEYITRSRAPSPSPSPPAPSNSVSSPTHIESR
jgi:vacuolar-type H+-ATPase subunit F/Vma7